MQIKRKIIFTLILISILSFTFSSANLDLVTNDDYDYFYSDYVVPGESLEWKVVTFVKETDFSWTIKDGFLVEEGDIIRFDIKTDPDELTLTGPDALQYTDQYWADFYLNDLFLGNDSSEWNYYIDAFDEVSDGPDRHMGYLLPSERESSSVRTNYFHDLVDESAPDCFNNETGLLEVGIVNDLFQIHWEYHDEEPHPTEAGTIEIDRIVEISYNLEWGYLDRMKIYESSITDEEQEILELVLENSKSTQTTPIEWVTGLIALFTLGTIAIFMRRRK